MSEQVVISGISGRFPECDSVKEFCTKLYAGEDFVTDDDRRWTKGAMGAPPRSGKLKDISRFDADFFHIPATQTEAMDPQGRLLLEVCYEAILDAGVNPLTLRGTKVGVFVAVCISDTDGFWAANPHLFNKWGCFGSIRALLANRISYVLDFTGPSLTLDTACSSSLYAMEAAMNAFKNHQCDAAIVAGSNLLLNPLIAGAMFKMGVTSKTGYCRSFDAQGDGYVRSEAVVAVFLQPASSARRQYAVISHMTTNADGYKERSMSYPSSRMQMHLLKESYSVAGVSPNCVDYIEAHGTGTKAGDPVELNAVAQIFCPGRKEPLLVGSVKSNMGHSEASSGLCAVTKVILAMERGELAPCLHYRVPNPHIPALLSGDIKVVTVREPWSGQYVGINSFGMGGANAHLILRRPVIPHRKQQAADQQCLPQLVCMSGRTEEAVDTLIHEVVENAQDVPFLSLLREIYATDTPGHSYRGCAVLLPDGNEVKHIQVCTQVRKGPVFFILSGLGSEWLGMARDLLHLDVFHKAVLPCAEVLAPLGIDLINLLQSDRLGSQLEHIFVAIVAVQIGLLAVLNAVGVHPDGIVGHSLGETAAAVADGCLTPQQAVLAAYYRGASVTHNCSGGNAMLAVGMSAAEVQATAPADLQVACDNGPTAVVVSGPEQQIKMFEASLTQRGIFNKQLASSGRAFHSKYIAAAEDELLQNLRKVIPKPRERSKRWISSSVARDEWTSSLASMCSAEYLTHNLVSPVLFRDACREIPSHAVVVEIAPHGVLMSSLRRSLPSANCISVQTRRQPALTTLMTSLGQLYCSGVSLKVSNLYAAPQFPVPAGTPMISPLIRWDHSREWTVPRFYGKDWQKHVSHHYVVDITREEDSWYSGHVIDQRVLFPATGYLVLAWRALAASKFRDYTDVPVIFHNVRLHQATVLTPSGGPVQFVVQLLDVEGRFVILSGSTLLVTGEVKTLDKKMSWECSKTPGPLVLETEDVYKMLQLRGYQYSGVFRGVLQVHEGGGTVSTSTNWVAVLDTILQVGLLQAEGLRGGVQLRLPVKFQRVALDPTVVRPQGTTLPVIVDPVLGEVKSVGVEVSGVEVRTAPRRPVAARPLLEKFVFVPYRNSMESLAEALGLLVYLVLENMDAPSELRSGSFKALEVLGDEKSTPMMLDLQKIFSSLPRPQVESMVLGACSPEVRSSLEEAGVLLLEEAPLKVQLLFTRQLTVQCEGMVAENTFVILLSSQTEVSSHFQKLACVTLPDLHRLSLLRLKKDSGEPLTVVDMTDSGSSFDWLPRLQSLQGKSILLVDQREPTSGLVGLVKCLRLEPHFSDIRCLLVLDSSAPPFSLSEPFYSRQLDLGLTVNVYHDGQWGTFQHVPLETQTTRRVEHAFLDAVTPGDLSSLTWFQGPAPLLSSPHDRLCCIHYSALNFRDIMLATGRLPVDAVPTTATDFDCVLGLEFSGRDVHSRECVMGMVPARGLGTTVVAQAVWNVPKSWTLEDAATVPVVYCTAYYALVIRGKMCRGETVLIHAGSGGVGQAAIAVALHAGCTVFTTVGSPAKRAFLKERFPQLTDRHIANSRDTSFEPHVMRETKGRGVDLVLNSLAEEKLLASVRCLAMHGRFLEIGKFDLAVDNPVGMGVFLKNASFHGVCLDQVLLADNHPDRDQVMSLLQTGIADGVVRPLPRTVFPRDEAEQAFRFMAGGQHIGKVLLQVLSEEKPARTLAVPRLYLEPTGVCIITGGLGGMGLELADWLVRHGTTRLVLSSRTGLCSGYKSLCVRRWREAGVRIIVSTADITTRAGTATLLEEANSLGQVVAVFHLAAVLSDALLTNQSVQTFRTTWKPKMDAARHLDYLTRERCLSLRHFVVFSSASAGRGNPGQSNYALACSAMERLMEQRRADGLPGLAVQWGPVADVGLAAKLSLPANVQAQSISSCFDVLERFMLQSEATVVSSIVVHKMSNTAGPSDNDLMRAICSVLGVPDLRKVPPDMPLTELGMDSLMQVEIRAALERHRGVSLGAGEMQTLTIGKLLDLGLSSGKVAADAPPSHPFLLLDLQARPLMPSHTLIPLNIPKGKDRFNRPLFIVHAVDGTCGLLGDLAPQLHRPTYGLQFTALAPRTTIQELATFYLEVIIV
ncbi:fatty acid synthase [Anabrus simplex]|uniref:fatty acid synthase n=1 Tax=Anabrus simplex TaxID=316456 RepID=UPI0035A2C5B2